jgi:hypothetical protein
MWNRQDAILATAVYIVNIQSYRVKLATSYSARQNKGLLLPQYLYCKTEDQPYYCVDLQIL